MKMKMKISFVVLMLIVISATTVAQSSVSFRMNSGRGSRNFSLDYSSFGDYGYGGFRGHGYGSSFMSYYRPDYWPNYESSFMSYYRPDFYRPRRYYNQLSYRPTVISQPIGRTTVVQRPVIVRSAVIQDNRANQEIRNKKERFLQMLKGEKKIEAIKNLVGFSFDKEVEVALTEILLTDPDPEIRKLVAESLGKTNNKVFLVALETAKEDTDKNVSREADASIRKLK